MTFGDLPLELLPIIIQHILRPHHLTLLCLVNKDFYSYTVPQLYERPAVYAWHREAKNRASQLFWTLANCPKLARYVRKLEIRDFPKAISRDSAYELTQLCVSGLANCINLQSCTWTRDGSLKDDILEALSHCHSLRALEINGRHVRNYNPSLLHKFERLKKISVIMPTAEVVLVLPGCFQRNFETLQDLTIICKFTTVVTDSWLQSMAPSLSRLKKLHLAGCPKVTHHGITDMLRSNTAGLTDLALENVSPSFSMREFSASNSNSLSQLSSITLTFPIVGASRSWLTDVETLLFDTHALKQVHFYASGEQPATPSSLSTDFVRRLTERHGNSLTRFAVLRTPVTIQALEYVVRHAQVLEQLFVSIWRKDLNKLGPVIAQSQTLRILHITYAYNTVADRDSLLSTRSPYRNSNRPSSYSDDDGMDENEFFAAHSEANEDANLVSGAVVQNTLPSMDDLEELASQFGGRLTQFGVQTRVWQLVRMFAPEGDEPEGPAGVSPRRVKLLPYESPDVPSVFLVVRT